MISMPVSSPTWPVVPLGSLLERIEAGKSPKALDRPAGDGEAGVIKVSAVTWNTFLPDENKALPPGYPFAKEVQIRKGDLLLSRANTVELIAAVVLVNMDHPNLMLSDKILRLVPKDQEACPGYLLYALRTREARRHFESHATGTSGSMRNISQDNIRSCPVLLPPLPEQKRIAAILDKADSIRRKRRAAELIADDLIPSIHRELFGDPVANPKRWETVRLGDMVEIASGGTPSKAREDYWTGTMPWVSPKDMKTLYIGDAQDHVSAAALDETTLKVIPPNSVLIVVRGMIMAHTIPVAKNEVEVTINQDMKAMTPRKGLHPEYLLWTLKAAHHLLLSKVSNAGHGTKRLEVSAFADFSLPLPAYSAQAEFASQVSQVRKVVARQAAAGEQSEACFEALVQRAFQGEL